MDDHLVKISGPSVAANRWSGAKAALALCILYANVASAFVYAPARLWPNGVVPFEFDGTVSAEQRTNFLDAMSLWENAFPEVTTVRFRARNGESGFAHLRVEDPGFEGGRVDHVGYNGGQVTMRIHPNKFSGSRVVGLIAHEFGHVLGLWHEQSRLDRDEFVSIIRSNIQTFFGFNFNFHITSPQAFFGPYDYDSIMHYGACSFSRCNVDNEDPDCTCGDADCTTIEVVSRFANQQCDIGQRRRLSGMDKRVMAFRYGPSSWKFVYRRLNSTATGSFEQPYPSFSYAITNLPASSTLWLGPGFHTAAGQVISTPMTLRAAIADLQMQPDGSIGPSSSGHAILR